MQYAKLIKLGGLTIAASDADYSDYKGFLRCLECGEPVFLRKTHQRGESVIQDAFVHHRAVPEISTCELRVGRYSQQDVEASHARSRDQRLQKLQVSMWKILKKNLAVDLKQWGGTVKDAQRIKMLGEIVDYGKEVWATNQEFVVSDTLPRVAELIRTKDPKIGVSERMGHVIEQFLNRRSRDWALHCQISKEALDLFLKSPTMSEVRHRLCCSLCHPSIMGIFPDLLDLDTETVEWREQFVSYITLYPAMVFVTIDWIEVFE